MTVEIASTHFRMISSDSWIFAIVSRCCCCSTRRRLRAALRFLRSFGLPHGKSGWIQVSREPSLMLQNEGRRILSLIFGGSCCGSLSLHHDHFSEFDTSDLIKPATCSSIQRHRRNDHSCVGLQICPSARVLRSRQHRWMSGTLPEETEQNASSDSILLSDCSNTNHYQ